ncbi:MAG TPA: NAD(P)/FAD-dependent oxidoreductase [Cyclobacteriaceae bacterium]|nr:NAD(P)/FAD-dependent oxidoreductase [Cyclobacteriaceae bacterium]
MNKKLSRISIVGAGLVGSLLAIYLKKRGYEVSVFERRFDMRSNMLGGGRSINMALSNRGLRALHEVGLDSHLRKNAVPMNGRMMHDVYGNLTFQAYGKQGQFINSISRSDLNMLLMNEAEHLGVNFFFEHKCLEVNLQKTELTFQHYGDVIHRPSDLIIGADGAFSAVRGALQISDRFEYSQTYIEHGYKELRIPASDTGAFQMEKEALHIWPRESYMLIALPNPDATFTCTLFFPFEGSPSFQKLNSPEKIHSFFESSFPDATRLMPTLIEDFRDNPTSSLVTVRCFPWHRNRTLLIGDAAHGIVPFYGQGMNAGFEDCRVLNDLLNSYDDDWDQLLPMFEKLRKPNADAIAQLALDNFVEMRDLVGDPDFLLQKKIEGKLHQQYPDRWIPLYSMVTFYDNLSYDDALRIGNQQKEIMAKVMLTPSIETTWESLDFKAIVDQLTTQR